MILIKTVVTAQISFPVKTGYTMGTLNSVWQTKEISGRVPWEPSAMATDSLHVNMTISGISWYGQMENYKDKYIYQANIGTCFTRDRFAFKLAYSHFDALAVYREQLMYSSFGCNIFKRFAASIDIQGVVSSLQSNLEPTDQKMYDLSVGVTTMFRNSMLNAFFSFENLTSYNNEANTLESNFQEIKMVGGLSTLSNSLGAQGIKFVVQPKYEKPLQAILGQEVALGSILRLQLALAANPSYFSIGIVYNKSPSSGGLSFVNHPLLGWSSGTWFDFSK